MKNGFSRWRWMAIWLCALMVVACGGGSGKDSGGGSSDSPATITAQPVSVSVRAGGSATFSVTADGTGPLKYQWKRNGTDIAGATEASYTLGAVAADDSGAVFTVNVSNALGAVSSVAATLKVPAKLAGILLQDEPSIQVSQAGYTVLGELLLELPGDLPLLRWKVLGATPAEGTLQPGARQFSIELPVAVGDNVVELVAEDGATPVVTYTKQIVRNPVTAFTGTLDLSRNLAFVDETTDVTARVAVDASLVSADSVKLVQVMPDGTENVVATLRDDGVLSGGDDVQGDGIYAASFQVQGGTETVNRYRAVAVSSADGSALRGVQRELRLTTHLPDTTLTAITDLQQAATDRLAQARSLGLAALKAAVQAELAALRANPDVSVASANDAGIAISVAYKSGIAGVIGDPDPQLKGGAAGLTRATAAPALRSSAPALRAYAAYRGACPTGEAAAVQKARPAASARIQAAGPGTASVGSNRVYALAANYSQWGEDDDVPQLAALLQKNGCLDVHYKKTTVEGGGSVDDFKNLGQYGLVLISSHGDTHYSLLGSDTFSAWSSLYKLFGWTPASAQVVLYSNMRVTTANKAIYEADLKAGRLVIWGGTYGVMPSFIRHYGGTMPSSVIYMSICRGSWNNTMADAFIANGAKAYLGYSDYVNVPFTQTVGNTVFTELLKSSQTLGDAYAAVSPKVESDSDPAEFRLIGQSDLQLAQAGLHDGGFESGTLGAWSATGDGRVIPQLGIARPEGKYMAIISSGLGFTTEAGEISQTLCLSTETALSFRWNFQSEEFLEYVGSVYQDAFVVTLTDIDDPSNTAVVQRSTIDGLAGSVSKVANSFDQGDVYGTGWQSTSFAIPQALRGKRVRLSFSVTDVGDSIYDTAVLIDEVTLQ